MSTDETQIGEKVADEIFILMSLFPSLWSVTYLPAKTPRRSVPLKDSLLAVRSCELPGAVTTTGAEVSIVT